MSVRDAAEAAAAMEGGADIVDAKEPSRGALGAVEASAFRAIVRAVNGVRPVSAALGDAPRADGLEWAAAAAGAAAASGADYVKLGFAGTAEVARTRELLEAAAAGARQGRSESIGGRTRIIAVAYADAASVPSLPPERLLEAAIAAGADGVLLDTARKTGAGLLASMPRAVIAAWLRRARAAELLTALAGRLARDDLEDVYVLGADIAGVRGAACAGGRTGVVRTSRVRHLAAEVNRLAGAPRGSDTAREREAPRGSHAPLRNGALLPPAISDRSPIRPGRDDAHDEILDAVRREHLGGGERREGAREVTVDQ